MLLNQLEVRRWAMMWRRRKNSPWRRPAGQEDVIDSGISGPVAVHLGASGALEDPAWLRVTKCPGSADVSQVIAAEFVVDCDVDNQVAVTAEVDVLEHKVSPPQLVVALLDAGDVAPLRSDPSLAADGLNGVEDGLVGCFGLLVCFLQARTWSRLFSFTFLMLRCIY